MKFSLEVCSVKVFVVRLHSIYLRADLAFFSFNHIIAIIDTHDSILTRFSHHHQRLLVIRWVFLCLDMFCDLILDHFKYHLDIFALSAANFGKHISVLLRICLCILIFDSPLIRAFLN